MKTILIMMIVAAANLSAADLKCGNATLVDNWENVDDSSTSFDLSNSTRRVKSLPRIVKAQLVHSAEAMSGRKFTDPVVAAQYIKDKSEGGDLSILKATIKGKNYSVVSYYGGGNHTGYIFKWGETVAIASISDDEIYCE